MSTFLFGSPIDDPEAYVDGLRILAHDAIADPNSTPSEIADAQELLDADRDELIAAMRSQTQPPATQESTAPGATRAGSDARSMSTHSSEAASSIYTAIAGLMPVTTSDQVTDAVDAANRRHLGVIFNPAAEVGSSALPQRPAEEAGPGTSSPNELHYAVRRDDGQWEAVKVDSHEFTEHRDWTTTPYGIHHAEFSGQHVTVSELLQRVTAASSLVFPTKHAADDPEDLDQHP